MNAYPEQKLNIVEEAKEIKQNSAKSMKSIWNKITQAAIFMKQGLSYEEDSSVNKSESKSVIEIVCEEKEESKSENEQEL